jgi:hypothetical protein
MKRKGDELPGPYRKKPKENKQAKIQKLRAKYKRKLVQRKFENSSQRRNLPLYSVDTTKAMQRYHTISFRPMTTGAQNYSLEGAQKLLGDFMRTYTRTLIQESTGWNPRLVNRQLKGYLQVTNMLAPMNTKYFTFSKLADIESELLDKLFTNLQQSEGEVPFENLEWTLVIDPGSYTVGAGLVRTDIRKGPGWDNYVDEHGPINCAAIALTILTKQFTNDHKERLKLKNAARLLQTDLGWGERVSIGELQQFVAKYPKYRLTCLTAVEKDFKRSTFYGAEYVDKTDSTTDKNQDPFALYLFFDFERNHFAPEKFPGALFRRLYNSRNYGFCHKCIVNFACSADHKCDDTVTRSKVGFVVKEKCERCLKDFPKGTHNCQKFECRNCKAKIPKDVQNHRCPIMTHEKEELGYWDGVSPYVKNKPGLWVYDFEAAMEKVQVPYFVLEDLETDDSDKLIPIGAVSFYKQSNTALKHNVNLIVLRNVISGQQFIYKGYDGTNPIPQMLDMLINTNRGNHICLAHNSSGYDTRMIYNYMVQDRSEMSVSSINNGTKFLELTINSPRPGNFIRFRDTLLHLPNSLRSLAEAFNANRTDKVEILKGHFPHLFTDVNYTGPIPDLKYFNTTFSCRTEKDYKELLEYHKSWEGRTDWNYQEQHIKYCIEDVNCLDMIVKEVDKNGMEKFGISQWKYVTMPAFISQAFKIWLTRLYDLPDPSDELYLTRVEECAQKYWCVDEPQEYAFTKLALRGGSTENRRMYYKAQENEKIIYIDQNSQYPAQQIIPDRMFSRGPPTCHVFNDKFLPCFKHRHSVEMCFDCPKENRFHPGSEINIVYEKEQWTAKQILELGPCGVIHCRVFVPDMFHPPLMTFDGVKAFSPCGEFEGAFTLFNIQDAIKVGVKILEINRIDVRKAGSSLWRDFMIPLYMDKECASKNIPTPDEVALMEPEKQKEIYDEWDKMIVEWEERAEMGEDIRAALMGGKYKQDKVIKTLSKFRINNIWGKNAENPVKVSIVTSDTRIQKDKTAWYTMFQECSTGELEIKSCVPICDDRHIYRIIRTGQTPNLTKGYLAAAVEVPAYGRRDQWKERFQMGKNVLYYDTDSIALIWKEGDYLPPIDNMIGGWEYEGDYQKGISEMVCPAPKNYAIKLVDGKTFVKAKGVRVGRGTENLVNFDTIKENTLKALESKQDQTTLVPQQLFVNRLGIDMRTMTVLKKMTASVKNQKGPVDKNGLIFPLNYQGKDFVPL